MKTLAERELQKNNKRKKKQRKKGARGAKAIVKGLELNDFVVHLSKVFFLQLTCKASLIF